jgi:O-acetyl-ADP-ribose deacetylase (regulator of RNase III)
MIEIKRGSILDVDVDVIVNAANSLGYMGGGVAGVIKRAGGQEIEDEAVKKAPIPVGSAIITTAGKLKFKGVIHAPTMERPAMATTTEKIKLATEAALEVADEAGYKSVALPGMGTGVGGVPKPDAAQAMMKAIKSLKPKNLEKIILVDIDDEMVKCWNL